MTFENVFTDHWLPAKPLCANRKNGSYKRQTRARALEHAYIETNPLAMQSLIVTDHDGADADYIADLAGLPQPSWVAMNPHTRSGHIVYALKAPVCLTDAGHRAPVNLLARVEQGLTDVLGGDIGYGGRITKNPTHTAHMPLWGASEALYGLKDLAKALGDVGALPAPHRNAQTVLDSTVGRNVALFNLTRQWAYRARLRYTDFTEWSETVYAFASMKNASVIADEFSRGPMSEGEVAQIAKSIASWVWVKITPEQTEANRKRWGSSLGSKSGEKRRQKMNSLIEDLRKADNGR
ncbi:MAG: replication initiation protein [Rothia sp. (in: high G+C Gram-positive bacteria)]|nr:replication initiation protein [Rothia sp. (in: high G+C Gram-positive bacteria)]